ncbi:hypothetical protein G9464_07545 [Halostella sp. JP-L12]|uniref:DUF7285 family protein n=1 Tax=Halostella TaxID=1843185 RepID=UPI000EF80B3E|nr:MULTISPECIES: hypothetical protein [Halostella]NHN47448.1 hypothetical protein [Halostella sp. JP-L12]
MSRSSTRRGQTEPLAVLAALFAVGAGIALYAGVVDTSLGGRDAPDADPTVDRVRSEVSENGVVDPTALSAASEVGPDGRSVRIELRADGREWTAGPESPPDARSASRRVSVRVAPGKVRVGRLRAEVWS